MTVSLVESIGVRQCPLKCAGRCKKATSHKSGFWETVDPSAECQLMQGPRPVQGQYLPMSWFTDAQLSAMSDGADSRLKQLSSEEIRARKSTLKKL